MRSLGTRDGDSRHSRWKDRRFADSNSDTPDARVLGEYLVGYRIGQFFYQIDGRLTFNSVAGDVAQFGIVEGVDQFI